MSQTVSIRLDDKVLSQLDIMSKIADRSRAWLMAQAVKQYVDREAWQVEAIQRSVVKLKNGTAKFTTHDAVTQWLESWGTENETEPPQCG
jgi:predicted transcriptional regulator